MTRLAPVPIRRHALRMFGVCVAALAVACGARATAMPDRLTPTSKKDEPRPLLVAPQNPPTLCTGPDCRQPMTEPRPVRVAPINPPNMCWRGLCPTVSNRQRAA